VTPPPESTRRARLTLSELEPREVLATFAQPTVAEQVFLERLNDARAQPAAYGRSIGVNLSYVLPASPLAFDTRLVAAAHAHSVDMNVRDFFGHTGSDGDTAGERLRDAGYFYRGYSESITAGQPTVDAALRSLIADANSSSKEHRHQLLGYGSTYRARRDVGIGVVQNGSGPRDHYYTVDTAYTTDTRPYLTGVVYRDANGNGKYDAGEGVGGATVRTSAGHATTTWATGGYSLRVSPGGRYTVSVSGGGLPGTIYRITSVGTDNQRLNFVASAYTPPVTVNRPPVLSAIGDRTIRRNTSVSVTLSASDPNGNPLTYSATVKSEAYELDQKYRFYYTGTYYTNHWGRREKWFFGSGGWYFIEPDGDVWKVGNTNAKTTLVARLESAYYSSPSKLFNATPGGRVSISGRTLTVRPDYGFVGELSVTVTVKDGKGGYAVRSFDVHVV
jgi:uncharacterized protein YkwD